MATKYGYSIELWEGAKEEVRQTLIERAKRGQTIPYSELVQKVTVFRLEPDSFALAHLLGELSAEEDSVGRGMLSVLVVHRTGDMQPGPGFFQMARRLGRDTSDKTTFWVEEFRRVLGYWSGTE